MRLAITANTRLSRRPIRACFLMLTVLATAPSVTSAQDAPGRTEAPPKLKSWSIGVRGIHLYDLSSRRYDTELSRDMRGLYGDHAKVDIGVEGYLEKQFTPLLGIQAGYRWGRMTGANASEYYKNSFRQAQADLVFNLSNIDKRRGTRRLGIYTKAGLSYGRFEADRYLVSDDSRNGGLQENFWSCRLGGGLQYRVTNYLRVELEGVYNPVLHDGFDGYNIATGSNPYLSTGLGVAYTFGRSQRKAMYGVNFFGPEYFGSTSAPVVPASPSPDPALFAEQTALKGRIAELQQQVAMLQQQLNTIPEPPAPPLPPPVSVYFEVSSARLNREAKRTLAGAFTSPGPASLTLTAYADNTGSERFNRRLKEQRADAVKRFITETVGYKGGITVHIAETQDVIRDNFLSRKVIVSFK